MQMFAPTTTAPAGAENWYYTPSTLFTDQGLYVQDTVGAASQVIHANAPASSEDHNDDIRSLGSDATAGATKTSQPQDSEQSSNIYVASLPPSFTDDDLLTLFTRFGPIVSAKVMCHRGTTTCKGYGFVLFEQEADAARAQSEMIGFVVGGNKIQVRRARAAASTPLYEGKDTHSGSRRNSQTLPPQPPAPYVNVPMLPNGPFYVGQEGMMYMMVPVSPYQQ